jgi:hypothetical protein
MSFRSFESDVCMSPTVLLKLADFALEMGDEAAALEYITDAYKELDQRHARNVSQLGRTSLGKDR